MSVYQYGWVSQILSKDDAIITISNTPSAVGDSRSSRGGWVVRPPWRWGKFRSLRRVGEPRSSAVRRGRRGDVARERGAGTKHHFHFHFSKKKLSLSLTLYQPPGLNITKIYKKWLRPSPKPKSQDHLVVSVGWLSLCRGLGAVKAKTGFKPTICCLGYSLKYLLFDILTFFLFCVTLLHVYSLQYPLTTAHSNSHRPMFLVRLSQSDSNSHWRVSSIF